jgi:hypothetical protein
VKTKIEGEKEGINQKAQGVSMSRGQGHWQKNKISCKEKGVQN